MSGTKKGSMARHALFLQAARRLADQHYPDGDYMVVLSVHQVDREEGMISGRTTLKTEGFNLPEARRVCSYVTEGMFRTISKEEDKERENRGG